MYYLMRESAQQQKEFKMALEMKIIIRLLRGRRGYPCTGVVIRALLAQCRPTEAQVTVKNINVTDLR